MQREAIQHISLSTRIASWLPDFDYSICITCSVFVWIWNISTIYDIFLDCFVFPVLFDGLCGLYRHVCFLSGKEKVYLTLGKMYKNTILDQFTRAILDCKFLFLAYKLLTEYNSFTSLSLFYCLGNSPNNIFQKEKIITISPCELALVKQRK